jgi:hypothetical protein
MNQLFHQGYTEGTLRPRGEDGCGLEGTGDGHPTMTLTASAWALCNTMLGVDRGNAQLALCLDEARLQVCPLSSEGIHYGVHAALMSVGSTMMVSILMSLGKDMRRTSLTMISLPLVIVDGQ